MTTNRELLDRIIQAIRELGEELQLDQVVSDPDEAVAEILGKCQAVVEEKGGE